MRKEVVLLFVCVSLMLIISMPNVSAGTWSSVWIDHDSEGGSGDYESLAELKADDYYSQYIPCDVPTDIRCRKRFTDDEFPHTGQVMTCNPATGSFCVNADNGEEGCFDYEVKFYCPAEGEGVCTDDEFPSTPFSRGVCNNEYGTVYTDYCSGSSLKDYSCNFAGGEANEFYGTCYISNEYTNLDPYSCSEGVLTPLCGNGYVNSGETCDDGNPNHGDGCHGVEDYTWASANCQIEDGYACDNNQPSNCYSISCGDGNIDGAEACDDDNEASGDGCSSSCQIESGWNCDFNEPTVCSEIVECGDGYLGGTEQCDDGDEESGDGCSENCQIELGWECDSSEPSDCDAVCGDGNIDGAEACDDDNEASGDGCSENCQIESSYSCVNEPSICVPDCGNGVLQTNVGEECDDGNLVNEDGCSQSCQLEIGECTGSRPPPGCEISHNNQPLCVMGGYCEWNYLVCTDNDHDGYSIEGGICGPVDCSDGTSIVVEEGGGGMANFILSLFSRKPSNIITGHITSNPLILPENINPGETEICGNNIDENCDGIIEACPCDDSDGDGYGSLGAEDCPNVGRDCNDGVGSIYPGANEICGNQIDDNCNYQVDEFCSYYSVNEFFLEEGEFYENAEISSACIFSVTGDLTIDTPGIEDFISEDCIQVSIDGNTESCNSIATTLGNETLYRTFACDVGDAGVNKPVLCQVNTSYCGAGLNASSETKFINVVSPIYCPSNATSGPITVNVNTDIENTIYNSGEALNLDFEISNILAGQDIEVIYETILYNLNTQTQIFNISQTVSILNTQEFTSSLILPSSTEYDKFRIYFKVYNPLDEVGTCILEKYDLSINSININPDSFDFDFRNSRVQRFSIALGETKTFTLDGLEGHLIEVSELSESNTFIFSSEPQNISLNIGDVNEIDLDGDGVNDISLNVIGVQDNLAEVELVMLESILSCSTGDIRACGISGNGVQLCINDVWTECDAEEISEDEQPTPGGGDGEDNSDGPTFKDIFSLEFYWYIIIGIIVLLLFIFVIIMILKKRLSSFEDPNVKPGNNSNYPPKSGRPFSPGMPNPSSRMRVSRR